jgi:hypothetical protein
MSKMTFLKLSEIVIKEEKKPLTPMEIWEIGKEKGYSSEMETQGKTPWQTIGARLYVDIKDNENSIFIKIKSKPVKFYLKSLTIGQDLQKIEEKETEKTDKGKKFGFLERDLHPFLSYYTYNYMHVYTKTIYHEKSDKKKFSQWIHPDIVGIYFPIDDWQDELLSFSKEIGVAALKLFSFELKRELGFHNLRESFFQAVSNSTWANEGYLVAAEIDTDEEFQYEIKRLSTSFGIGIIQIDINDPDSTKIIYPARSKNELDWENMNKLADENPDFKEFLKRIKTDYMGSEVRKELYDKIYEAEKLLEMIKK